MAKSIEEQVDEIVRRADDYAEACIARGHVTTASPYRKNLADLVKYILESNAPEPKKTRKTK